LKTQSISDFCPEFVSKQTTNGLCGDDRAPRLIKGARKLMSHEAAGRPRLDVVQVPLTSEKPGLLTTMRAEELLSTLPTPCGVGLDETVVWHDLFVLVDSRYPQRERWVAAQWIAYSWFKKPIAPQRWRAVGPAVKRELTSRAKTNGTSPRIELQTCVAQALFLAGHEPVDFAEPGPRQAFLRRLNDIVVEDLVGPDWRELHHPKVDIGALESVLAAQIDLPGEVEAMLELEALIAKSQLGPREAEVLSKACEGKKPAQIAMELGVTPSSVRTALSRARGKLRANRA
jgi:DNA-binding CsgD family transcriptional regulator